jgi:hypothetical protein
VATPLIILTAPDEAKDCTKDPKQPENSEENFESASCSEIDEDDDPIITIAEIFW